MRISLVDSRANGFSKWSTTRRPGSKDDDRPGGAAPIALSGPALDNSIMAPPEQPLRPWLVPGVGRL